MRLLIPWLIWLTAIVPATLGSIVAYAEEIATPTVGETVRVQLMWHHHAEFAGMYVAQMRRHFAHAGLNVEVIEGAPGVNSLAALADGSADVALAWLESALDWQSKIPITNIAQIFDGSSLLLLCRISAGIYTPKDLPGQSIGIWGIGDEYSVHGMLKAHNIPKESVKLITQRPNGLDLVEGKLNCVTALAYNEYWRILEQGIPADDLLVLRPEAVGIQQMENGLYVRTQRLANPAFQSMLVRFLRALREGWMEAIASPTLATKAVQQFAPGSDADQQRLMLETIAPMIPEADRFGLFNLDRYAAVQELRALNGEVPDSERAIWTHRIWNALQEQDGRSKFLTAATEYQINRLIAQPAFQAFVLFGVLTFALSGVLEAVNRGYDFWGRLILAVLSGLGGGTLRDLLIGGDRLPLFYITNPVYPLSILTLVLITSLIVILFRDIQDTCLFKRVKSSSDIVGFAVLAVVGAQVAVAADMSLFWVPICAALTCAGGGMLRDIVINQEPRTFKGMIYEETAIVGGLVLVAGLAIANQFEHSSYAVYLCVAAAITSVLVIRTLVQVFDLRYPSRFFGPPRI